ncbi:MAG TPA: hypothetical protein VKB26_04035 [Candidatus Acidoferrales bacterium]|nr:hypothetical protein [Candidatus Acidoferrales bacterium]
MIVALIVVRTVAMTRRSAHYAIALGLAAALCLAMPASAQDFKAATSAVPVPAEVSSAIRGVLSPVSTSVTSGSSAYCEIWMRTSIPANAASGNPPLGVNYGQFVDGEIVGAIHLDVAVKDFRNQPVKPGTYLMRYGLQPVDGNHQGVSDFRDFLLLTPAAQDTTSDNLSDNDMYALSRKATTTGHPSVWSLVPTDSAPTLLPGTKQDTNEDLWTVYFKAAAGSSPLTVGLVIFGHAATP